MNEISIFIFVLWYAEMDWTSYESLRLIVMISTMPVRVTSDKKTYGENIDWIISINSFS